MLELGYRLNPGQEAGTLSFNCPLKQSDLADALGMTPIHVNRILRKLRILGLMSFEKKRVTIPDYQRLCRLAEFNATYLRNDGSDLARAADNGRAGSAWPGTYG
jgi:transcriptional regulator with XRE-family HTH domain